MPERQAKTVEIRAAMESRIKSQSAQTWVGALSASNVPAMALQTPAEVLEGDHFLQRGVVQAAGDSRYIGMPFRIQPLDAGPRRDD